MSEFLRWQFRQGLQRIGWGGVAALGVTLAVAVFHFGLLLPLQATVDGVRAEVETLRQGRLAVRRAASASQDPLVQLAEFYSFFPAGDSMTAVLGRIYAAAQQTGLVLEHGEYQLASAQQDKLLRYDIALPVSGPYPKLRKFIAQVLQENPGLALDGVSFTRQAVGDPGVSAQVRMSLYLKATP